MTTYSRFYPNDLMRSQYNLFSFYTWRYHLFTFIIEDRLKVIIQVLITAVLWSRKYYLFLYRFRLLVEGKSSKSVKSVCITNDLFLSIAERHFPSKPASWRDQIRNFVLNLIFHDHWNKCFAVWHVSSIVRFVLGVFNRLWLIVAYRVLVPVYLQHTIQNKTEQSLKKRIETIFIFNSLE